MEGFHDSQIDMDAVRKMVAYAMEKCRVQYFDFYLFHNVCEKNIDGYLDPKYGIFDYLIEQKRKGRIKHLGFSTHGSFATMERFLKAYGEHMEFGQIQLNWLDYEFQKASAWAFRFLQTIPEVVVTLSGMSNMEQLEENINTYSEDKPLSETEWKVLQEFAEMIKNIVDVVEIF